MTIEERIAALRQQQVKTPFCWLICFEDRPLQGIPPGGKGAHLLVFSSEARAKSFIEGRQPFYGVEPLTVLAIDFAETLKDLALAPTSDPRYSPPPCGLVMDFDYSTFSAGKVISPAQVARMTPSEIAAATQTPPLLPGSVPPPLKPASTQRSNLTTKRIAIGAGILVLVLIVFFIGRGVVMGMKSGKIPAFSFMNTPTLTPTVTMTPTVTVTPTPTQKPWDIHYVDDFSSNKFGWTLREDVFSEGCGTESRYMETNSLVWTINVTDGCDWQQSPELMPVTDFEAYVDVERVAGSYQGAMGMVFNSPDYSHTVFFLIDDTDRTYSVYSLQEDWTILIDWSSSTAILSNDVNRVGMLVHGNNYTFVINGERVATITIEGFTEHIIGLGTGTDHSGDIFTARFKNFELFTNR